ncbi:MAG: helix-turn-helix domain-containing protein [Bacteroidota bacterium]|nr:helix-turn-helix domain-containing protein [Bacteroidota bacterium]
MKTIKEREKFIQLRANGLSYDKISKQLNISKPTLINWNFELGTQINDLTFIKIESIIKQYEITKVKKVEFLSKQLNKIHKEIEKRTDLKKISYIDLLKLENNLTAILINETTDLRHTTDKTTTGDWDLSINTETAVYEKLD